MITSSILFSGNNFNKMELFANFLRMGFPSQSSFTRLQRRVQVTNVDDLWQKTKKKWFWRQQTTTLFSLVRMGFNVAYFYFHSEKDNPAIKHSHDIWHAAKNLGKKLLMVSPEYQKQTFSHAFFQMVLYINGTICISSLILHGFVFIFMNGQFNFDQNFNCQCRLK